MSNKYIRPVMTVLWSIIGVMALVGCAQDINASTNAQTQELSALRQEVAAQRQELREVHEQIRNQIDFDTKVLQYEQENTTLLAAHTHKKRRHS